MICTSMVNELNQNPVNTLTNDKTDFFQKRQFIKILKKRIKYDDIIEGNLNCNKKVMELFQLNCNFNFDMFFILETVDKNDYDLPEVDFYLDCYDNCVLSKLFINKSDKSLSNVISFFMEARLLLDICTPEFIKKYLDEEIIFDAEIFRICKVIKCAKKILVSQTSRASTLDIIKDSNVDWENYCTKEDETLLYAFVLIKRLLCNIDLPLLTFFAFEKASVYKSGLSNFDIEVLEINQDEDRIKKTVCLPSYIINHVITVIDFLNNDFEEEEIEGQGIFKFKNYI
ncbi:hypothetical protein NBO_1331g0001 [Nosema bombycis CQ1]|uniref:Uncharacterized protein n=1 Tax=Nosema bombycis (strain CQ1 / CVCC 102059) TaxID=578461 RepID=R0MB51_NOSB1|nr:hypothetical protein NBO_1331g0001 [Nosema bombycis CQ1]|eukprot:EOB11265.1 hypothetical protein NBO_1331g0001 [Nosema bombycis CQ1]